jgi:hypothetical protein
VERQGSDNEKISRILLHAMICAGDSMNGLRGFVIVARNGSGGRVGRRSSALGAANVKSIDRHRMHDGSVGIVSSGLRI